MDAHKETHLWQVAGVALMAAGLLFMPFVAVVHWGAPTISPGVLAVVLMGGFLVVAGFAGLVCARLMRAGVTGQSCALLAPPLGALCLLLGLALLGYTAWRYELHDEVTLRQVAGGAAGSFLLLMSLLVFGAQRVQARMLAARR